MPMGHRTKQGSVCWISVQTSQSCLRNSKPVKRNCTLLRSAYSATAQDVASAAMLASIPMGEHASTQQMARIDFRHLVAMNYSGDVCKVGVKNPHLLPVVHAHKHACAQWKEAGQACKVLPPGWPLRLGIFQCSIADQNTCSTQREPV